MNGVLLCYVFRFVRNHKEIRTKQTMFFMCLHNLPDENSLGIERYSNLECRSLNRVVYDVFYFIFTRTVVKCPCEVRCSVNTSIAFRNMATYCSVPNPWKTKWGCINPAVATDFRMVAPHIWGSTVWYLLHVTLLVPKISSYTDLQQFLSGTQTHPFQT